MSISRYMVALLDAPPIRSGKRGYMDCGFPAALVSRVILRSVRRARTAFWQFSRLPRRPYSNRPEPTTHRLLTHNHCLPSPDRHLWFTRSSRMFPQSVAQVYHRSPACTRSSPLYPQTCKDPQTIPRQDDPNRARMSASSEHVYSAFNTCDSTARDVHSGYVVKNINLQYKPPQKMRSCRWLVGLAYRATMTDS